MAVVPRWVTRPAQKLSDVHWLAARTLVDTGSERALAVQHTLAWITGLVPAPVTDRAAGTVTREDADLELRAASALLGEPDGQPHTRVAEELGIPAWTPPEAPPAWTTGVYDTLLWLCSAEWPPPLEVPVRDEDGQVVSAEDLFDQAVAAEPARYALPRDRTMLRLSTARQAARSHQLAELIADTMRRDHTATSRADTG